MCCEYMKADACDDHDHDSEAMIGQSWRWNENIENWIVKLKKKKRESEQTITRIYIDAR